MNDKKPLSDIFASFVTGLEWEAIPASVRDRAKLLLLDAVGNAYASTQGQFAHKALAALSELGCGDSRVIGMPARLALRESVMLNGMLVHGMDYDDTYLPGSAHLTASCVPTALGVAAHLQATGRELLTALTIGLETAARIGAAANGGFVRAGFHGTSMAGTFACSLVAGRLMHLGHAHLVSTQGIALSTVSGTLQPMQDGSWTKRMHPGWSGASGITAATMARQGFIGPSEAYEGRFGLFSCFLGEHAANADPGLAAAGLGERWEFPRTSIKLYPACHQLHAFMNAAIELSTQHDIDATHVESVRGRVAEAAIPLVCEPLQAKLKPDSSYAAQFSLPYALASSIARRRFGLAEIEESAYSDPQLLALAQKVTYEIDPDSGFPKYRSGEVIIRMKNGTEFSRREKISPDEPAPAEGIVKKAMDNMQSVLAPAYAAKIRDMILEIDRADNVATVMQALAGTGQKT